MLFNVQTLLFFRNEPAREGNPKGHEPVLFHRLIDREGCVETRGEAASSNLCTIFQFLDFFFGESRYFGNQRRIHFVVQHIAHDFEAAFLDAFLDAFQAAFLFKSLFDVHIASFCQDPLLHRHPFRGLPDLPG